MPRSGPVPGWQPPKPAPPPPTRWEQYLKLLDRIRFGSDAIRRWERISQNARGLAATLVRDYDSDVVNYPDVRPHTQRHGC